MTENSFKGEAFNILEKLNAQQRALMQALLFVFPEPIKKAFLVENLEQMTTEELSNLLVQTNKNLKAQGSDYHIVERPGHVYLIQAEPAVLNPLIWGALSSEQRQLLIAVLSSQNQESIEQPRLQELNYRLSLMMLGRVHKRNKSYYLEPSTTISPETLLQSVVAFQQDHAAHFAKKATTGLESE